MTDQTAVKVLADSIGPHEIRLTTLEVTLPRPYLAEFNTHRMLSRNSASSRAIPTEKLIERARTDPYLPVFNQRVTGMGVGVPLDPLAQQLAQDEWLSSRDAACKAASLLLHTDKSRANRLLEPFLYQTIICSATEWANFFALRDHPAAQPEFRRAARLMRAAMDASTPKRLDWGEWHLPLVFPEDNTEFSSDALFAPSVSAGRCARVSYDRHHESEGTAEPYKRWGKLSSVGHWSPGEHPARVCTEAEWDRVLARQDEEISLAAYENRKPEGLTQMEFWGNFRGWVQLRKHYDNEEVFNG